MWFRFYQKSVLQARIFGNLYQSMFNMSELSGTICNYRPVKVASLSVSNQIQRPSDPSSVKPIHHRGVNAGTANIGISIYSY